MVIGLEETDSLDSFGSIWRHLWIMLKRVLRLSAAMLSKNFSIFIIMCNENIEKLRFCC